jgi:hypothetical protein
MNEFKQQSILNDLKYSRNNGIKQLLNLYINVVYYKNLHEFINNYNTSNINSEILSTYVDKNDDKLKEDKINYYYYKIDYLAKHKTRYSEILNKNYINQEIKKKIEEFKDDKFYQHKKNPIYISYIEPLISIDEIEEKIIDTYTKPNIYINKLKIKKSTSNIKIRKLVRRNFNKYDDRLSKTDLFNTIKFIFNTFTELLYFRIRNNKLECAYHLYNPINIFDWYKYIKYKSDNGIEYNLDESLNEILTKSNKKEYFTLKRPHYLPANHCLLGFESYNYYSGNPITYVKGFYEMIMYTINTFKIVPDCDIIINRKDFYYITKDFKYGYNHLIPDKFANTNMTKFWFIGSQCVKKNSLDIPVPASDEWDDINKNFEHIPWKSKIPCAVFRGSSTGCGTNTSNNLRLKLSQKAFDLNSDLLDVGISKLITRIKSFNQIIKIDNIENYNHLKKDRIEYQDQMKYKYIFNIEGNVQSYRFSNEFKKGSVILNVKSEHLMWFDPLIKKNKDCIIIEPDFNNILETIEYLKENDDKAEEIAKNGIKFNKTFITKNKFALYWFYYMVNINKRYKY